MTAQANMNKINEYVMNFISDIIEQDMEIGEVIAEWNENEVQQKFQDLVMEMAKTMVPKEKKEKKAKSPKDPNKPKRGKSPYIFFCAEERENVKKDLPTDTKPTEITRELGARWKALSASKKKKDIERVERLKTEAAEDKERYNNEMEGYQAPSDDELATKKKDKKKDKKSSGDKKKDPNEPKRPRSAYIFYCTQTRNEIKEEMEKAGEDTKGTNVTKKLGEGWKVLSGKDSPNKELYESFVAQAKADKERYDKEMEVYKSGQAGSEEKKSSGSSDKVKKETGYGVFCRANRAHLKENCPELSAAAITKQLGKMWKELSKEDKKGWMDAAAHKEVEEVEVEVEEEE